MSSECKEERWTRSGELEKRPRFENGDWGRNPRPTLIDLGWGTRREARPKFENGK
jgi:hypothetical protein